MNRVTIDNLYARTVHENPITIFVFGNFTGDDFCHCSRIFLVHLCKQTAIFFKIDGLLHANKIGRSKAVFDMPSRSDHKIH